MADIREYADLNYVYCGDCLEALKQLPDCCVDAVVTDPPAGIGFMGKTWDKPGVLGVSGGHAMPATTSTRNPSCRKCGGRKRASPTTKACECEIPDWNDVDKRIKDREAFVGFLRDVMVECRRVLKPGGHAVVWALPRTSHWTATAIEDAGLEVRDIITHIFGTGFPKSADVSKHIDKAAGAEREVVGMKRGVGGENLNDIVRNADTVRTTDQPGAKGVGAYGTGARQVPIDVPVTAPATDSAKQWQGWGTALKPASEHWILARKPLDSTVAVNVQRYGTGAINVDACRVSTNDNLNGGAYSGGVRPRSAMGCTGEAGGTSSMLEEGGGRLPPEAYKQPSGRWPANLVLSHNEDCQCVGTQEETYPINTFDDGMKPFGGGAGHKYTGKQMSSSHEVYECTDGCVVTMLDEQSGKVGGEDRRCFLGGKRPSGFVNTGANRGDPKPCSHLYSDTGGASRFFYCTKASRKERGMDNKHPTCKPLKLMRWLCRLVTPPGGVILDPFAGSGSTGVAARQEGFDFLGFDMVEEYVEIANKRITEAEVLNG